MRSLDGQRRALNVYYQSSSSNGLMMIGQVRLLRLFVLG